MDSLCVDGYIGSDIGLSISVNGYWIEDQFSALKINSRALTNVNSSTSKRLSMTPLSTFTINDEYKHLEITSRSTFNIIYVTRLHIEARGIFNVGQQFQKLDVNAQSSTTVHDYGVKSLNIVSRPEFNVSDAFEYNPICWGYGYEYESSIYGRKK